MLTYSESAQSRAEAASRRLAAAEKRVRASAREVARRRRREFFDQHETPAWTAWGSLLLSLIGLAYSWSFYGPFEIPVFYFFDTSDFLLSAFHNMRMLVTGVLTILIGVGVLFLLAYSSSIYLAYRSSIPLAADFSRKKQRAQVFWTAVVLLAIILVAFLPRIPLLFFREEAGSLFAPSVVIYLFYLVYLAYPAYRFIKFPHNPVDSRSQFIFLIIGTLALTFGWGVYDNKAALKEQSRFVTVVLNKDFAQAATHPLNSALLLGTTSRFHFFYVDKCEDTQTADKDSKTGNVSNNEKTKTNEKAPECKNGRPFIIPTANIAALEFIDTEEPDPGPEQIGLPDILASINQLNETISALKFDATINMQSGKVIFDTKAVANAIAKVDSTVAAINKGNETNTNQITEAIKGLNPLTVEPNPNWTGLIGALTTLNQTVSTLKPPVVPNPGSNDLTSALTALTKAIENFKAVANPDPKTVDTVAALNATLRTLNATIAALNVTGAGNHCTSGWEQVVTIQPFCEGEHDRLEKSKERNGGEMSKSTCYPGRYPGPICRYNEGAL